MHSLYSYMEHRLRCSFDKIGVEGFSLLSAPALKFLLILAPGVAPPVSPLVGEAGTFEPASPFFLYRRL